MTITLVPLISIGTITPAPGLVTATGDATTLANLAPGAEIILSGTKEIYIARSGATAGTFAFEIIGGWPSTIGVTPRAGYAIGIDNTAEDQVGLILTADAAGNTAGRATYNAQADGFRYLDAQAGFVYERNGPSGNWTNAGTTLVLWVSTTGNNANTTDGELATLQFAVDLVAGLEDLTGWTVIIGVKAGTYAQSVILKDVPGSPAAIKICGEASLTGTPNASLYTINSSSAIGGIQAINMKDAWTVEGISIGAAAGHCLYAKGARLRFNQLRFNAAAGAHLAALAGGSLVLAGNGYTINGAANAHLLANGSGATIDLQAEATVTAPTITINATYIFKTAFAWARASGHIFTGTNLIFTNKAGAFKRWRAEQNSSIDSGQSGERYLPGAQAGVAVKNGEYI